MSVKYCTTEKISLIKNYNVTPRSHDPGQASTTLFTSWSWVDGGLWIKPNGHATRLFMTSSLNYLLDWFSTVLQQWWWIVVLKQSSPGATCWRPGAALSRFNWLLTSVCLFVFATMDLAVLDCPVEECEGKNGRTSVKSSKRLKMCTFLESEVRPSFEDGQGESTTWSKLWPLGYNLPVFPRHVVHHIDQYTENPTEPLRPQIRKEVIDIIFNSMKTCTLWVFQLSIHLFPRVWLIFVQDSSPRQIKLFWLISFSILNAGNTFFPRIEETSGVHIQFELFFLLVAQGRLRG